MLRGFYLIFISLLLNLLVIGQDDSGVKFNIVVKHKSKAYPNALVKVFKSNSFLDQSSVNQEGSFSYLMPYGFVYQLHFTGEGMATKIIELDLISNVPDIEKNTVHDWTIGEIELFKAYKDIDITKLEKPVAKIHYESDMSEFSIDYKYTGKRKKELATVEAQVEKLEKEEAIVEKANKKEYEELVIKGNQALNSKQFNIAQNYFEKAVLLNEEGEAKQKLSAINKVLSKEKQYDALLSEGKSLKEKGELQMASEKFIAASALKPTSQFPKQQISLIAQKIKEEEKQANAFNNYMTVANRAYSDGNYVAAAANYNKALDLNPDALLASSKLKTSETKIKELEVQEAKDQKFNNLIVDAKNARVRGDLEEAELILKQAESVKPNDESLIEEKTRITNLINEEKEKEIAAEKIAVAAEQEKENKYSKYVELGKKSRETGNTKEALFFYNKAKDLKPESAEVKLAIASINKVPEETEIAAKKSTAEPANLDLDKMDKKSSEFQSKLASLYPEGKTVNKSSKGNKTITQVIVVNEGKGVEYQKIKYNWGGIYFFRNGDPISQLIFDKETK